MAWERLLGRSKEERIGAAQQNKSGIVFAITNIMPTKAQKQSKCKALKVRRSPTLFPIVREPKQISCDMKKGMCLCAVNKKNSQSTPLTDNVIQGNLIKDLSHTITKSNP